MLQRRYYLTIQRQRFHWATVLQHFRYQTQQLMDLQDLQTLQIQLNSHYQPSMLQRRYYLTIQRQRFHWATVLQLFRYQKQQLMDLQDLHRQVQHNSHYQLSMLQQRSYLTIQRQRFHWATVQHHCQYQTQQLIHLPSLQLQEQHLDNQ